MLTPLARPFSMRIAVTGQSSTMRTPPMRAPLASACVTSDGLAWPSLGRKTAPTRSAASIGGQSFCASAGDRTSTASPKLCAVVAWRSSSVMRSLLQASRSPPLRFQPVAWPVSASSRS